MRRHAPRSALALLAVLLPTTAGLLAPAHPALAVGGQSTSNEVAYTLDDYPSADSTASPGLSVVLRSLASGAETTVMKTDATTDYDSPFLSPTGDRVVATYDSFSADGTTDTSGLAIAGRGGGTITRLTSHTETLNADGSCPPAASQFFDAEPTLSPDGSTVLYTQTTGDFCDGTGPVTFTLMTVPAAGGTPVALPGGSGGAIAKYDPTDPSGGTVVLEQPPADLSSEEGPLYSLQGGTATPLGVSGGYPIWSPDGSTLAVEHQTAGAGTPDDPSDDVEALATVPRGGTTETVLPVTNGAAGTASTFPSWLPDGQSLVYTTFDADDNSAVLSVDKAGSKAQQLFALSDPDQASHASANGPAPSTVTPSSGSFFTAVTPTRLLDTRAKTRIGGQSTVGKAGSVTVQVTGAKVGTSTVPADATAVVLNVTAVGGTTPTVVRAYPAGSSVSETSALNTIRARQTVPNQATVQLGTGGAVTLYNGAGSVDLLADITGYYSPSGVTYHPLTPTRLLDSRSGNGTTGGRFTTAARDLQVTGRTAGSVTIPADATGVVLNVTGVKPSTATFVRVYPTPTSGNALPVVSTLNLARGEVEANLATVQIGAGGKVRLQNAAGTTDLVADVAGYYAPSTSADPGAQYVPISPTRFLDTRSGLGTAPGAVGPGQHVDLAVDGRRGVPDDAVAVALNVTGTATSTVTLLRAYPSSAATVPTVSNLNLIRADSRANAAIVTTGTAGVVRVLNGAGTLQVVLDVAGYFVPVTTST